MTKNDAYKITYSGSCELVSRRVRILHKCKCTAEEVKEKYPQSIFYKSAVVNGYLSGMSLLCSN